VVFHLDARAWAEQQFGGCQLGDKRRTKRLIQVATQVAHNPAGSFPDQLSDWAALKAAYRLFDAEHVTFAAIAGPHWEQTRQLPPGRYLVVGDTTEIDFGYRREIAGLKPVGNGSGRGFLLHNALLVDPASETVLGLAGQTIHYRRPRPKHENASQRFRRERESKVWGDVIDQIGRSADEVQWIHVFDRGGDDFEVFCHLLENGDDWVVRASSLHRQIEDASGNALPLEDYLPTLPVAGAYELALRARPGQPARTATLEVRFGALRMPIPRHHSAYVKQTADGPISMQVVWVRETSRSATAKPIEWVLYTSLPVRTFQDAWQIIEYYECRWLIEEYHKALKTGCQVQSRLLQDSDRLETMVGLMSVTAVRLLQLKTVARQQPDLPAKKVVPTLWLEMLKAARKKLRRVHDLTIYAFYRELAKLGGFLGRTGDGEPGWITIWRGWEKLNTLVRGAELASELQKCG
jgi:hypothetical protein